MDTKLSPIKDVSIATNPCLFKETVYIAECFIKFSLVFMTVSNAENRRITTRFSMVDV